MAPEPTDRFPRGKARATPLAFCAVVLTLAWATLSAAAPVKPGAQLSFGAQMAQRGLWAEAKFRFEQVAKLDPSNARALGNLAVAYEALGQFEQARSTYERALKVEPGNVEIKRNHARFEEFYAGFKGGKGKETKPPTQPDAPTQ